MDFDLKTWQHWFVDNRAAILKDYFTFLRFRTIGVDPTCQSQCRSCAEWLVDRLKRLHFTTHLWETASHPIVFAEKRSKNKEAPTLLVYHHYDVQPVDPLELWNSDPFEPVLKGNRVYARGAQDNKGQCTYTLAALEALTLFSAELPFHLKLFIEGDEEGGSRASEAILASKKKELQSDAILVVDALLPAQGVAAIVLGVRGILGFEITCKGAKDDLHSGEFGGVAYNPLRALSTALASLWDREGNIAVPQFYEDVRRLSPEEKALLDFEVDAQLLKEMGIASFCQAPGFSLGESRSLRPTIEINGFTGGYSGAGLKTIIPKEARAKLSCRLVPDQNPQKITHLLQTHLEKQMPKGMRLEVEFKEKTAGYWSSPQSFLAQLTKNAFEKVMKKPCRQILSGASIPLLHSLAHVAGGDVVLIGYGLPSDQIHAPNEHFDLDRLEMGFLTMGYIFAKFAESA